MEWRRHGCHRAFPGTPDSTRVRAGRSGQGCQHPRPAAVGHLRYGFRCPGRERISRKLCGHRQLLNPGEQTLDHRLPASRPTGEAGGQARTGEHGRTGSTTSQESFRAAVEARRAVGAATAPVSLQDSAMQRYLEASTYHTNPTTAKRAAEPALTVAAPAEDHRSGTENPVVVGIDGSGCARNAGRWAADEATRRQTGLRLIHAYHLPPAGTSGYNPYPPHLLADLRQDGAAVLQDTAKFLQRSHPDLIVTTELVYGDPATVLRHASASAALVVVEPAAGRASRSPSVRWLPRSRGRLRRRSPSSTPGPRRRTARGGGCRRFPRESVSHRLRLPGALGNSAEADCSPSGSMIST